jgi:hypothetical protein
MANRNATPAPEGETRVGTGRPGVQGVFTIVSATAGRGAVLCLQAVAANGTVTDVYFWASSDGKMRGGTTFPADTEAGTVIGTQT